MKLSVGLRIGGGFIILLLLLAVIAVQSSVVMNATSTQANDIDIRSQRISLDYQIKNSFQEAALAMRGFMFYGDNKYLDQYTNAINKTKELVQARVENSSTENRPKFEKMVGNVANYDNQISQKMVPLLKEKKMAEATAVAVTIAPITAEINGTVAETISQNEAKSKALIATTKASVESGRKIILVISLVSLIAGILLAFFTTRSITAPVKQMMGGVQRLAGGDFTQDISVNTKSEIGDLAQALNTTRQQLRGLVGEIVTASQTLAAQSEELASSAEEVSATVEEVASTTNEVAAMAEKSMENAGITSAESKKAVEAAISGGETVRQTVIKINSISEASGKVNQSIQSLGQLSMKIGNITNVITGIADQTNLLALNAAIEAARAGDQGRGFAVVAEEVRKLAEQSASAAREIGDLINQIKSGVDVAISAMEQGAVEVGEGVHLANQAGDALNNIIQAINKNIELVEEINQGANQTSDGTQQLSASNEQVTSAIQQVSGATQELAAIANKLQFSVSKFTV